MSFLDIVKFFEKYERYIFDTIEMEHFTLIEYLEFNYGTLTLKPIVTLGKNGMYEDIEFIESDAVIIPNGCPYQKDAVDIYELYMKLYQ